MATLSTSSSGHDYSAGTPILRSRQLMEGKMSGDPRQPPSTSNQNHTGTDPEKQEGSLSPVSLGGATAVGDENDGRPTLRGRRLFILIGSVA